LAYCVEKLPFVDFRAFWWEHHLIKTMSYSSSAG
jgi:hypothetical protein